MAKGKKRAAKEQGEERRRETPPGRPSPRMIRGAVFVTGLVTMAVELAASRVVAPTYGTTLIVWTALIGTVMVAMAAGAWLGGRRASSDERPFWKLLAFAGLAAAALPFLVRPALAGSIVLGRFSGLAGPFVAVALLLALPMFCLGMSAPMAVGLVARDDGTGRAAGSIYAWNAAGSILGCLLPAFVLVPLWGSLRSMFIAGAALVATALVGARRARWLVLLVPLALVGGRFLDGPLKRAAGLIHAEESRYNYIQVCDDRFLASLLAGTEKEKEVWERVAKESGRRYLVLNEGHTMHSMYAPQDPRYPLVGFYFDTLATLPFLPEKRKGLKALAVGLGAGTGPHMWSVLYGESLDMQMDGVEIDPRVIAVGREYFGLAGAEATGRLRCHGEDGRMFFRRRPDARWDLVVLDVFRQPYIPFHLATREYFATVREHLNPGGVMAMNVGVLGERSDFFDTLLNTVADVFGPVHWIDLASPDGLSANAIVLASRDTLKGWKLDPERNPEIRRLAKAASCEALVATCKKAYERLRRYRPTDMGELFTDDHSCIEWYTQKMAASYLLELARRQEKARAAGEGATGTPSDEGAKAR